MKLIITEKNDAAEKIASLLGTKKPQIDKVYNTTVYRFEWQGEECVAIGLRGHIVGLEFVPVLTYDAHKGWYGVDAAGNELSAAVPDKLEKPPFKKSNAFTPDGVGCKSWDLKALPYLVYAPMMREPKEKDIIRSLKNLAKKADSVVIATDFDREGELIGSDALRFVREVNADAPVSRARYSAFTKDEIISAFTQPAEVDFNLADAGQSRREIDLIWGAVLTRFLSRVKQSPSGKSRSVGRVQTPTLALVVAREREREAFIPEDYWVIKGAFGEEPFNFEAGHEVARFKTAEDAQAVMNRIAGIQTAQVSALEKKTRRMAPPAPFNTSSLMAAAAGEGLSPSRTMRIAESLYMRGLISYPRVDNTVYPKSLDLADVVRTISVNPAYAPYCNELLKRGTLTPTRGKQETTDHPPIYPTAAASPDALAPADWKLYNLVARRFLATLSDAAVIEGTKINLDVHGETFVARGDVYVKKGFRAVYPFGQRKETELPALEQGDTVAFNGATCTQKQTEPPARYSQAKLVAEMEKLGLGTKSTRAGMVDTLYERGYVQNDPIEPTSKGIAVIDALGTFAPEVTHPEMTADLEEKMSAIISGDATLQSVVMDSRAKLADQLDALMPHQEQIREALASADAADAYVGTCPSCGKNLVFRSNRRNGSRFIGCDGYPDCTLTYTLPDGKVEVLEETCPVCGLPRVKITPWRSSAKTACINPDCLSNQQPKVVLGLCPVCGDRGIDSPLHALYNPKTMKRFVRCQNFEECKTSYPLPQTGSIRPTEFACEHCGAPIIERENKRGTWQSCVNPQCPSKEAKKSTAKSAKTTKSTKKPARTSSKKTSTKSTRVTKSTGTKTANATNAKRSSSDNAKS